MNNTEQKSVRLISPNEPAKIQGCEKALFAAGCFWGVQAAFETLPGVKSTIAGYAGGHTKNPTYKQVCTERTGHAEAVLIEYHPEQITYEQLLEVFWQIHDPTTQNRQGPDVGTRYRSAIFYLNEKQKEAALLSKQKLQKSGKIKKPIVTKITPASAFYIAEDYHQNYFDKNPNAPCHIPEFHLTSDNSSDDKPIKTDE